MHISFLFSISILLVFHFYIKEDTYILHYYTGNYVYDIKVIGNDLYVDKNEVIQCFTKPCNPIKINSVRIKYSDEYKISIESIFNNKNSKEVSVLDSELSDNELKIMSKIIKKSDK